MSRAFDWNPKPYFSVSQLEMLSRCGEQYRRRYIEGDIRPPGIAAAVGRGVDDSVNQNLIHKVEHGALLDAVEVKDLARDAFSRAWREGVLLTSEERSEGLDKVKGRGVDKTVRLASFHHFDFADKIDPISTGHVQRRWRIALEGFPRDLVGVIDVQERMRVRDTKTASKAPPKNAAHVSLQGTAYLLVAKVIDGEDGTEFSLDYLVDGKFPKSLQLKSTRSRRDFQMLLDRVEAAVVAIDAGVLIPASPGDWICSKRWCGYWDSCRYAARPKSVQIEV